MTLGHLSLRDPSGRGFWLKRNRIGLGEVLGPADFVLVDWDGQQIEGTGGRHSEWPIHSEILRVRPDLQVVAHTHPFHACVFSASLDPLQPFTVDADYFVDVPRHEEDVALITTKDEGAALANALGQGFAVLMANHGVTFCGTSVAHAVCVGIFLEKACKAQIGGLERGLPHRNAEPGDASQAAPTDHDSDPLGAFLELFLPQADGAWPKHRRIAGGAIRLNAGPAMTSDHIREEGAILASRCAAARTSVSSRARGAMSTTSIYRTPPGASLCEARMRTRVSARSQQTRRCACRECC